MNMFIFMFFLSVYFVLINPYDYFVLSYLYM